MGLFGSEQETSSQLQIPDWMKSQVKQIPGQADSRILNRGTMSIEDMVAGMNPAMVSSLAGMSNWAGGQGGTFMDMLTSLGNTAAGGLGQGMEWLGQAAGRGPAVNAGPNMGNVANYANDPYLNDQITAALRDPFRDLTENQIPGARMAQALSGNTGSTRGAIGEAVLNRGYDDRAADVGAMMRGNAWNQGLGIEANRSGQNAQFDQNFSQLLAQLGGQGINAGMGAGNLFTSANNMGIGNLGLGLEAGQIERGIEQEGLNAGIYNFNQPMNDLLAYSGLINPMASQYGKNVTTSSTTPGLGSVALGVGSMMMGMPGAGAALTGGLSSLFGPKPSEQAGYQAPKVNTALWA